jgi:hypothetical protein
MQMLRFAQHDSPFFHSFEAFPHSGAAEPLASTPLITQAPQGRRLHVGASAPGVQQKMWDMRFCLTVDNEKQFTMVYWF